MVAAPQYATFTAIGAVSKKTYTIDAYLSDVADALVNWDGGAGASSSSPDDYVPPEPIVIIDFSIKTGMTDTTKIQTLIGGRATGDMIRYANYLNTMSFRPRLLLGVPAGARLTALQRA